MRKQRLAVLALLLAASIELAALARTLRSRRRPVEPAPTSPYRSSAQPEPASWAPGWYRWHWVGATLLAGLAAWLTRGV